MDNEPKSKPTSEALRVDDCTHKPGVPFAVFAVVKSPTPAKPDRALTDMSNPIRMFSCCASHAMEFGWINAEDINRRNKKELIVGVVVKRIPDEEAADMYSLLAEMKKKGAA